MESFSLTLQIFTNSLIALSEKAFPIGPLPISLSLFLSIIIIILQLSHIIKL